MNRIVDRFLTAVSVTILVIGLYPTIARSLDSPACDFSNERPICSEDIPRISDLSVVDLVENPYSRPGEESIPIRRSRIQFLG